MTYYRRVRVKRPDAFASGRRETYFTLLREVVYAAVDALTTAGLIEGYDFLTHPDFDLRLWIPDAVGADAVREALQSFDALAAGFEDLDAAPAETGPKRVRLLRRLNALAEITRDLLPEDQREEALLYTEHYLLNQHGMTNLDEARWHLRQAQIWLDAALAR